MEILGRVPVSDRRREEYQGFRRREGRDLEDWATWCALAERYGPDWRSWPGPARDPRRAAGVMAPRGPGLEPGGPGPEPRGPGPGPGVPPRVQRLPHQPGGAPPGGGAARRQGPPVARRPAGRSPPPGQGG